MAPVLDALPEPLLHGVGADAARRRSRARSTALYPKGDQWYWRADFVNEISDEAIASAREVGAAMPTWKSTMHLYPIDGAVHDVGSDDTAWRYRDATGARCSPASTPTRRTPT